MTQPQPKGSAMNYNSDPVSGNDDNAEELSLDEVRNAVGEVPESSVNRAVDSVKGFLEAKARADEEQCS